jgi:rhodanese-related sulfurtransferase
VKSYVTSLGIILLLLSSQSNAADHTSDSLEKVKELLAAKKAVLVDVREQVEWDAGHIEGAKLVPMSKLKGKVTEEELKKYFPADKIAYLYCAGGYRCLDVAEMFEDTKLPLRALKQGYTSLLKAGFPKASDEKKTDSGKVPVQIK